MARASRSVSVEARVASIDLRSFGVGTTRSDWNLVVWLIFFLQGVGALLPWNVAIQASGYYAARVCGSPFENNFLNWFGIAFNLAQVIFLVLSVRYLANTSLYKQVVWPLAVCVVAQVVTLVFVVVTDVDGSFLFGLTLFLTFASGGAVAVLQGGVFGLAGKLPEVYTGALMSGIGLAGFGVSLSAMITVAAGSDATCAAADDDDGDGCVVYHTDYSALAYFAIATAVLFLCLASYFALVKHPFVLARVEGFAALEEEPSGAMDEPLLLQDNDATPKGTRGVVWAISRCIFNVMCAYAVTLALYPSVTASVVSTDACPVRAALINNDLWAPVGFAVFNLCDLAGRLLAAVPRLQISTEAGTWVVLARLAFFPGFMLSNVSDSQLPTPLANDAFFFFQMVVFAVSGGFVGSLAMMRGPGCVKHPADQQLAGTVMALALTMGLTLGSFTSFGTLAMISGGNPFNG